MKERADAKTQRKKRARFKKKKKEVVMFGWAAEKGEAECIGNVSGFSHFNYF